MGIQTGYGFIHYALNDLGVSAAMEAVNEMTGIILDLVTYECTVSHGLRNYLLNNSKSFPMHTQNPKFFGGGIAESPVSPRGTPFQRNSNPVSPRGSEHFSSYQPRLHSADVSPRMHQHHSLQNVNPQGLNAFAINRSSPPSSTSAGGRSSYGELHFPTHRHQQQKQQWRPPTSFSGPSPSNDNNFNFYQHPSFMDSNNF
jgi:hypothetical protein